MNDVTRKYLDYAGLKFYDELARKRTADKIDEELEPVITEVDHIDNRVTTIATYDDTEVEKDKKLKSGVVKDYIDALLEGKTILVPVYYVMVEDPDHPGQYIHVYNYEEAHGTALPETTYYERKGKGSTLDPYYWVVKDPQPEVGESVEGLYTQGSMKETIDPDEVERQYPVPDPDDPTKQKKIEVTFIADTTETTIINTMAETATIPENEIIDLFEEI